MLTSRGTNYFQDYYAGGDLLTLLLCNNHLSVESGRFYASEVVSSSNTSHPKCTLIYQPIWKLDAISFLHSLKIVHRNIRAESVWINGDGHVVLSDFSQSKVLPSQDRARTSTNCGSREYQAPEMILGWEYDFSVDCWGFGILLYLLHFGRVSLSNCMKGMY